MKDQLLANGAYQGFTPALNKLKKEDSIGKQIQSLREKTRELPLPSFQPQIIKWSQETLKNGKPHKENNENKEKEELWKEEQEKRREAKSEQRKERA